MGISNLIKFNMPYSVKNRHKRWKDEVHPRTGREGSVGEYRYSCTLSLTSALEGVCVHNHAPAVLPPGKRLGNHWTWGWMGPKNGLNGCAKSRPTEIRSADLPAPTESLYRLHYPGPLVCEDGQLGQQNFGLVFVARSQNCECDY